MAIAGGLIAILVAVRRGRLGVTLAGTATLIGSIGSNANAIENVQSDNRFAYAPAIAIGAIVAALT
jgi:hypothetical protein